ncbi:hypothetical protein, variant 1 [Phytophthora nicotianae]|uniref:Uncharacterized protein n=1 Tax=Phytophthora nicotianae TaxID=4792 RepID=W2LJJ5_PHYNI|nr:hypothetical protein, variant 1 [Phytophthora nicotianae]
MTMRMRSPFSTIRMAARDACWWLSPWKKLDQEWQAACARGQQQLAKVADSVQRQHTSLESTGGRWLTANTSNIVRPHGCGIWHIGAASDFKMKWMAWQTFMRGCIAYYQMTRQIGWTRSADNDMR